MNAPIFSRPRFCRLKNQRRQIDHALVADGCIINYASISNSIVGLRMSLARARN